MHLPTTLTGLLSAASLTAASAILVTPAPWSPLATALAAFDRRQSSGLPGGLQIPQQCQSLCESSITAYSSCQASVLSCLSFCNNDALNAFYTCANCAFEATTISEDAYNQITSVANTLLSTCSSLGRSVSATTTLIPYATLAAQQSQSSIASVSRTSVASVQATATGAAAASLASVASAAQASAASISAVSVSSVAATSASGASASAAAASSSARAAAAAASDVTTSKVLVTNAVTYCGPSDGLELSDVSFTYFSKNNSAVFNFGINVTAADLNPNILITLSVYGENKLNYSLDICSGSLGGFICPLPQIALNLTQPLVLPDNLDIPELAYTVPNLEAFATIQLIDAKTGARRACVTAKLSNGKSTKQLGVLIGTGAFAVVAILLSWWHTGWNITRSDGTFAGENVAASSINAAQWRVVDIIYLFQTIASTGLLSIPYPTAYTEFVLNFKWAMGVWHTTAVQKAIDNAREITGGASDESMAYPEAQFVNRFDRYSTQSTLAKRSLDGGIAPPLSTFKSYLSIPPLDESQKINNITDGIPLYANSLNVATRNIWMTVFFTWLIMWAVFLFLHALFYLFLRMSTKTEHVRKWKGEKRGLGLESWQSRLRRHYPLFFVSNALRLTMISFFPIAIFSMYQFISGDGAWLPIFLAAFVLFIQVATLLIANLTLLIASRRSYRDDPVQQRSIFSTKNRESLYETQQREKTYPRGFVPSANNGSTYENDSTSSTAVETEYGSVVPKKRMWSPFAAHRPMASALYTQYRRPLYWYWLFPLIAAVFAKACFLGLAQGHGNVQVIGLIILEGLLLVIYLVFRPENTKKGDWLSVLLRLLTLIATGLLLVFTTFFNVGGIVKTIIALAIVAVFGLAVVLLFVDMLFNMLRFLFKH